MTIEHADIVGRRLLASGYVAHTIDPNTKTQRLKVTKEGQVVFKILKDLLDTAEILKNMKTGQKRL